MATSAPVLTFDNSSDAAFRAWGSGISTALAAVGLVKTTDTGQIDWTAVTRPVANNTAQGYEIWRFNDTLQTTRPVYIKVEYGAGATATAAGAPGLWITVGSATNGAGSLTTLYWTRRQVGNQSSGNGWPGPTAATCYVSSNGGYLTFLWAFPGNNVFSLQLHISRTCDANGTDNGDAVQVAYIGSTNNTSIFWLTYVFLTGQALTDLSFVMFAFPYPPAFNTGVVGTDTYYFPQVINVPKQEWSNGLMSGYTVDLANLAVLTVPNNGANHGYIVYTGVTVGFPNYAWLMRYE